jgi:phosphoglycolate phosphatase/pyrophosphatase PpaX
MKYKCLVLDHDDTVVDSTRTVHFPCFVEYLEKYYPHFSKNYTLESYLVKNFHPGISELLTDEIGLGKAELEHEVNYWANYCKSHIPTAFSGIGELISDFKAAGGTVVIDSHSLSEYIKRDFSENALPTPDFIYGWDIPSEQRKPSPYTLFDIMKRYGFKPTEILVVDDLKPGYDMARGVGVDFAAAGWAYDVKEIREFMKQNCDFYLEKIEDLRRLLFN